MRQEGLNIYLERADLEKMHTNQLIRLVRIAASEHINRENGWINYKWDDEMNWWYNEQELRDILKNRPHIPNSKENKANIKKRISESRRKVKRNLTYNSK